jgi:WD40 repeat protein
MVLAVQFLILPIMALAIYLIYPINGDVVLSPETSFQFSPDGKSVVFGVLGELDVMQIYSVRATGGSTPLFLDENIFPFYDLKISPDSRFVIYIGRDPALKSVPLSGGAPVTLWNKGLADFQINANSKFVVLKSSRGTTYDYYDLFAVPIAGSEAWQLSDTEQASESVVYYDVSPDGRTVVFSTLEDDGQGRLYSVPIEGGELRDLATGLGGDVQYPIDFRITPDSSTVVFRAKTNSEGISLFSVPTIGGQPVRLAGPIASPNTIFWFEPTRDSRAVLFTFIDRNESKHRTELNSIPLLGGLIVKLAEAQAIDKIRQTDRYIAYSTYTDQIIDHYIVPRSGGPSRHVGGPFGCPGLPIPICASWQFEFTPDGRYLLFSARVKDIMNIYSAPTPGGPTQILATATDSYFDLNFQVAANSSKVYYFDATAAGEAQTIMVVSLDGNEPEPVIPAPAEFSVNSLGLPHFLVDPVGDRVLFGARWPYQENARLYVASPNVEMLFADYLPLIFR